MTRIPGPAEKDPAEGSRATVERELARDDRKPAPAQTPRAMNPGDAAAPGTAGTGEVPCPNCRGSGRLAGTPCPDCGGTGTVVQAIGGG